MRASLGLRDGQEPVVNTKDLEAHANRIAGVLEEGGTRQADIGSLTIERAQIIAYSATIGAFFLECLGHEFCGVVGERGVSVRCGVELLGEGGDKSAGRR